jgi:ATP-dependent Clp protease, protease subunit
MEPMDRINANYRSGEEEEEEAGEPKRRDALQDPFMEKFLKTRTILVSGEIDKDLSERVVKQALLLEAMGDGPVKVFIDSPGGDADAGFAVFDMLRFISPPVWTIGMGLVASAASIIALAAPKERRVGLPNSHYLIHQPLSGMRGVASEIEIHAREIEKFKEKINRLIAQETGQDYGRIVKDTDRDCWLNADEAVSYGLISRTVRSGKEISG